MSHRSISRREWLELGVGAMAGLVALPSSVAALNASVTRDALDARGSTGASRPAETATDVALDAARWIRGARTETKTGVTWPADPLKPGDVGADLYNGMPGVVLFHVELFHATGDRAWLDDARTGANELIAQLPALDASADCGLYTGLAGAAFVLEEAHRATGDGRYRDAATRALSMVRRHAEKAGGGVAWTKASATNDIISGSAGIGLFLLWAERRMGNADSRAAAIAAGRRLLEVGQPANGGTKWAVAPSVKNLYPNFSHGTAGVSYFLATLYERTGDRPFLDAALSGAKYLEAVANTEANGTKVFHHEPGGENLYYLSWCHGPAGTSRLFYRLSRVTHDAHWTEMIRRAARATIDSGVPERQSAGYWNNISQCCGNCGVGEHFIALQRIMPAPEYDDVVRRVTADTLRRGTPEAGGMKWIQAENRVSPDAVVAQTGYMQGASGVGSFYLHADAAARNKPPAIVWPDSPFE